jgi:hypothetical protein
MFRYLSFFSGASFFLFLFLFLFLFFSSLFLFFLSFLFLFSSLIFFSLSFLYFFFSLFFSFSFFLSLFFCFCLFCFVFVFCLLFFFGGDKKQRNLRARQGIKKKKKEIWPKKITWRQINNFKKKKKKKETLFFFLSFSFISFPSPSVLPFLLSYECSDANKPGEATEDPGKSFLFFLMAKCPNKRVLVSPSRGMSGFMEDGPLNQIIWRNEPYSQNKAL